MSSTGRLNDPAQRDIRWSSYHPRALAPAIVFLTVVSLIVWTGRWYLEGLSDFADQAGSLVLFGLAWTAWFAFVAVFLYRTVTYTYRLTDRSLLVEFGFLSPPVPAIPLVEVSTVVYGGSWLARGLGVGWVEVRTADRAVRLIGVRKPEVFALAIRAAIERAKEPA
jgi:membrane protein YdbS with pleckstrin-like domain